MNRHFVIGQNRGAHDAVVRLPFDPIPGLVRLDMLGAIVVDLHASLTGTIRGNVGRTVECMAHFVTLLRPVRQCKKVVA